MLQEVIGRKVWGMISIPHHSSQQEAMSQDIASPDREGL
jgi:hypothetical protein